jgi:hypothetical protein
MINGIQHIGIGVSDRDRSYEFYRNALNFTVPISKNTGNCMGVVPFIEKDEIRNVVILLEHLLLFQKKSAFPTMDSFFIL